MSKYGNRKTTVDGIVFDSQAEARRHCELRLLERAGRISGLRRQVPYVFLVHTTGTSPECGEDKRQMRYVADFVYVEGGREVVEDVKGYRTAEYKRKRRLMQKIYGVDIRETR